MVVTPDAAEMNSDPFSPTLSVVLPTDDFETIAPVLSRLTEQTMAGEIEVIVTTPDRAATEGALSFRDKFGDLRVVEVTTLVPLAHARAAGIQAARAPFIFLGETHSFLHADAAEILVAKVKEGPWSMATPGFENANPGTILSWSAFLAAYGGWSRVLPAGEIAGAPVYDVVYRREVFAELGPELENALSEGEVLRETIRRNGHRIFFEPRAGIDHLNIQAPGAWIDEHFLLGFTIGWRRARRWSVGRRLFLVAASPLIPFLLTARAWRGLRSTGRKERMPAGVTLFVFLVFLIRAFGELLGYLGLSAAGHEHRLSRYEIRRTDYV